MKAQVQMHDAELFNTLAGIVESQVAAHPPQGLRGASLHQWPDLGGAIPLGMHSNSLSHRQNQVIIDLIME